MALPIQATIQGADAVLAWLLSHRLSNYGYDTRSWRRLQAQRSRAKRELRTVLQTRSVRDLAWNSAPLARRIQWEPGVPRYVTGQSQNEELTNLMRQLVNPEAPWVS